MIVLWRTILKNYIRGGVCINRKRKKLFIIGVFFFIIMSISGVYALTLQSTLTVINTGLVKISIDAYKINDENAEIEYANDAVVFPGETTSLIPRVTNLGADCYLRIKVDFINNDINFVDYVAGFSSDFVECGDYYYYDKILSSGETIQIFESIKMPDNVGNLIDDREVKINIIAEAVQCENIEPDYSKEDPWDGIVPTKNESGTYNIEIDDNSTIRIEFDNSTKNDINVSNTFLDGLKDAMPGDTCIDTIEIKNNNNVKTKYYFKVNLIESKEKELLKKMNLIITNEEDVVIYNGELLSNERILLGEIDVGAKEVLTFKVFVPKDLSNEYSNLNPKPTMIFASDYKGNSQYSSSEDAGTQDIQEAYNTKSLVEKLKSPNTGDRIDVVITIFLISATGLIITMILDYAERKRNID